MAGVFKSLDKSDVRLTPFRTYKLWSEQSIEVVRDFTIPEGQSQKISNGLQVDFPFLYRRQGSPKIIFDSFPICSYNPNTNLVTRQASWGDPTGRINRSTPLITAIDTSGSADGGLYEWPINSGIRFHKPNPPSESLKPGGGGDGDGAGTYHAFHGHDGTREKSTVLRCVLEGTAYWRTKSSSIYRLNISGSGAYNFSSGGGTDSWSKVLGGFQTDSNTTPLQTIYDWSAFLGAIARDSGSFYTIGIIHSGSYAQDQRVLCLQRYKVDPSSPETIINITGSASASTNFEGWPQIRSLLSGSLSIPTASSFTATMSVSQPANFINYYGGSPGGGSGVHPSMDTRIKNLLVDRVNQSVLFTLASKVTASSAPHVSSLFGMTDSGSGGAGVLSNITASNPDKFAGTFVSLVSDTSLWNGVYFRPQGKAYAVTTRGQIYVDIKYKLNEGFTWSKILNFEQQVESGFEVVDAVISQDTDYLGTPRIIVLILKPIGSFVGEHRFIKVDLQTEKTDDPVNFQVNTGSYFYQTVVKDGSPHFRGSSFVTDGVNLYGIAGNPPLNGTIRIHTWPLNVEKNQPAYKIYKADYNPKQDWNNVDPLKVSFDQLNRQFDLDDATTTDGKFQRVVHRSIDHLYYRDFYTNNKASFGSGNINKQKRYLEDQAYVISVPQKNFGESLLPGSVRVELPLTTRASNGAGLSTTWNIEDDSFGNLFIKSGYRSPYTNLTWSGAIELTASAVGEWPSPSVYKYIMGGKTSFVDNFNQGSWTMTTEYNNLYAGYLNFADSLNGLSGALNMADHIGAAWLFSAAASSSIIIKPGSVPEYMHSYNFEDQDFTISLIALPDTSSQNNVVILTKEGPVEQLLTDENGNPYSQVNYTKTPYRITYTSSSLSQPFFKFEIDGGQSSNQIAVSASVSGSLGRPTLVIASKKKSTSEISIEVHSANGIVNSSSAAYNFPDNLCSNPSYIYIGNNTSGTKGFNGYLDNIKFFRNTLSSQEKDLLKTTVGVGNLYVGNVFYNHGMITLTSNGSKFGKIDKASFRGTHTIWETEVSCTVSPGEFGMSSNPSLQEYDSNTNQYVYKPLVTGSSFKPYITTIGLYDDYGRLLVVGKLSTPIQTPNNMDTTFIVRYDK